MLGLLLVPTQGHDKDPLLSTGIEHLAQNLGESSAYSLVELQLATQLLS